MPFCYSIYYHILSIFPLVSSFFFLSCCFFLIFIICCLLKLSSLLGWSLRCLKIKKMSWLPRYHSHTISPGECPALSSFLLAPPLLLLPTSLVLLCGLTALFSPGCNYHGPQFLFLFSFSFFPPPCPFFHPKPPSFPHSYRSPLVSLFRDQFNQTIQGMKLLGQSFPVLQPGSLWSVSPVTVTHAQDDTASVSGIHRVSLNTAAEAWLRPMFSPECRITPQRPSLRHGVLTYIYPALLSATETTGTAWGDKGAPLFLYLFSDFGIWKLHQRSCNCHNMMLELWTWNCLKGNLLKAQYYVFLLWPALVFSLKRFSLLIWKLYLWKHFYDKNTLSVFQKGQLDPRAPFVQYSL